MTVVVSLEQGRAMVKSDSADPAVIVEVLLLGIKAMVDQLIPKEEKSRIIPVSGSEAKAIADASKFAAARDRERL